MLPDVQQLYDAPIVGRDVQVPDPVLSHESQVVLQVRSHVEYPVRDGVRQHRLLLYRYSFARFFACSVQGGTYSGLQRCDIIKGKSLHGIFLSEELGVEKPNIEFFEKTFSSIGQVDPRETIIIGDSLSSDIRGGNNAGILTCWYNPSGKEAPENLRIDYEIGDLHQVFDLL